MTAEKSKVSEDTVINAFTDGACNQQAKRGGWGFVLTRDDKKLRRSGGATNTTNNQMELVAVIEALKTLKDRYPKNPIVVHSDSQYVIKGMNEWLVGWKQNNWIKSDKKPVLNRDLWIELDSLNEELNVDWNWVKAHNGNVYNEEADQLARQAIPAA